MTWFIAAFQIATVATLALASRFLKYGGMIIFLILVFLLAFGLLLMTTGAIHFKNGEDVSPLLGMIGLLFLASLITSWLGELLILINERLATHLDRKLRAIE